MSAVEVRQLRVGEWRELRELRLEALRDAPDAFATTLAEATARTDERWQADAARGSGTGHPTFVAEADGRLVGMVTVFTTDATAELTQMFVRGTSRGDGVGRTLVDAVVAWASAAGFPSVELGIAHGNAAAERLYGTCGFGRTGEAGARTEGAVTCELRMTLAL
jgi:GNAT superfamily N-acetyltransferase